MLFERTNVNFGSSQLQPQITQLCGWLGGIDKSDVPYVYHHLRKGCILQVHPIKNQASERLMLGVNYGAYRLGILSSSMARRIQELEAAGMPYRLTIAGMVKEKYLPPTGIELELAWGHTPMAEVT